jgi:hypothetical protein
MRFSHSVQPKADLSSANLTEAIATEAQRRGDLSEATRSEEAELGQINRRPSHYGIETEPHVNLNIDWARIQKPWSMEMLWLVGWLRRLGSKRK